MVTITTKEELEKALENKEKEILVEGEMAKKIIRKKKVKKGILIGGIATTAVGIILLPFTGGGSSGLVFHGLTVATGTTTVTMTAGELAILLGFTSTVASIALLKGYTIQVGAGNVLLTRKK